jgi:hypothetical protein
MGSSGLLLIPIGMKCPLRSHISHELQIEDVLNWSEARDWLSSAGSFAIFLRTSPSQLRFLK